MIYFGVKMITFQRHSIDFVHKMVSESARKHSVLLVVTQYEKKYSVDVMYMDVNLKKTLFAIRKHSELILAQFGRVSDHCATF